MTQRFPRFSPDGSHLAQGHTRLLIDGVDVAPGTTPVWRDNQALYYTRQPDGARMLFVLGAEAPSTVSTHEFNDFAAVPDRWVGYTTVPTPRLIWDDGVVWRDWASPALSASHWAACSRTAGEALFAGVGRGQGGRMIDGRPSRHPRLLDGVLVWNAYEGGRWRVYGRRSLDGPTEDLTIEEEQFWPVPVRLANELWLLSLSHTRLLLYPWGSTVGWVVASGHAMFPDAVGVGTAIKVAWTNGDLGLRTFDVREPRIELGDIPFDVHAEYDALDFLIGDVRWWPKTGSHYMHVDVLEGRQPDGTWAETGRFTIVKSGDPAFSAYGRWDQEWVYLHEDHTDPRVSAYIFKPGHWCPRRLRHGLSYRVQNVRQDYASDHSLSSPVRRDYDLRFVFDVAYDHGGAIGRRPALIAFYDNRDRMPVGQRRPGSYEYSIYAFKVGQTRFEEWKTRANNSGDDLVLLTSFNELDIEFGPIQAVPPWRSWTDDNSLPTPPTPPSPTSMTLDQFLRNLATDIPHDIVLGALARFRAEHCLERDKAGTTGFEAGVFMYFLVHYAKEMLVQIGRRGAPGTSEGWGHLSVIAYDKTIKVYRRDQGLDPPDPSPPAGIAGQLHLEDGAYKDDNGFVLPIFCHFGEAFSRWTRDANRIRTELQEIAEAGYSGIRFWDTLGSDNRPSDYWYGREVGPHFTPDYWNQLRAFLRTCREVGLKVHWCRGDVTERWLRDRPEFFRNCAQVASDVGPDLVALFEGANESWQTGEEHAQTLRNLVKIVHDAHPQVLCALSAAYQSEDARLLEAWTLPPATIGIVHGYRQGHWWDKVRHIFSLRYEGKPNVPGLWQGEPTGPGNDVSDTQNKHELNDDTLAAMACMALMTGQAWNYMSGFGVRLNGAISSQPGFSAVPKVSRLLPTDIMTFKDRFHGGEVFAGKRAFQPHGETRCDHAAHHDGRFAVLVYGPSLQFTHVRGTIDSVHDFGSSAKLILGHY